jgi:aromatic-L-amino-acid decarboxylase
MLPSFDKYQFFKSKFEDIHCYFLRAGNLTAMNSDEFREKGKEMIDYVSGYLDTIDQRPVLPLIKPGYLKELIPTEAPNEPDKWSDLMQDIERVIMPGVTHWHSPHFHAYFPTANSYPSICADILSDAIGCIGFSWVFF